MDTQDDHQGEPSNGEFQQKTNEQLNEENPNRRKRKQATEEQLNNPLHGVKLVQILERVVDYYGWRYLAERVNIRCFKYNPTMKSSVRFLRTTPWAREHVEDVYLDMLEEIENDADNRGR
ncbi:MAG: hypothetical protein COA49_02760 [Bacteroidetes bacterium]|nr:MAG: hypothetical protein COA49_02760 [Bacteroidota bacterium]